MTFLLDTNACIALLNGRPAAVRYRLEAAIRSGVTVQGSTVVAYELWYGAAKSARQEVNSERLRRFISERLPLAPFDADDARVAGELRATLESAGRPIGSYDYLIAAQALRREWTLVTASVREFARVRGLRWQDWARGE